MVFGRGGEMEKCESGNTVHISLSMKDLGVLIANKRVQFYNDETKEVVIINLKTIGEHLSNWRRTGPSSGVVL